MHVITGGAGFVGSSLLWQLNRLGITDIIIVDNLGKGEKWRNLVNCQYADYLHKERFLELIDSRRVPFRIESLTHLGACSSTTQKDADYLMENNFHYSQKVCRYVLEQGGRFINASSAATYGGGEWGFMTDADILPKLKPLNMYGYSKHLFDLWLQRAGLLKDVISLKFFNIYGPNEYHKGNMASVPFKLHQQINQKGYAALFASNSPNYADGEQKRDFVYIKDCVRLIAWLIFEARTINRIYNVGTGAPRSFNEVARLVFLEMQRAPDIRYIPMPQEVGRQYQNYTCADMSWLAASQYPYSFHTLEQGIGDYIKGYLASSNPWLDPAA